MKKKVTFKVDPGIFSIPVLRQFTKNTGAIVLINGFAYVEDGKLYDYCSNEKLCMKACDSHKNCHVKNPEIYLTVKDD